ncbi:proline-rich receptor-like protein kinase PERK1 [Naviculisporaceae sp. PSN 640]
MHYLESWVSFSLLLSSATAFSPLVRRQSGKSWAPARETGRPAEDNRMGWSPKPTGLPNPGPRYGGMDLLRRASDFTLGTDTCGFVSGSTPLPVTCVEPGAYCTDDGVGNMDCCTGQYKECTSSMYSACLDYSASERGACESAGPRTICCWSESPSCFTLLMTATATPGKFYSIFQCQTFAGVKPLYASPPGLSTSTSSSSEESTTSSTRTSSSTIQLVGTTPPGTDKNNGNGDSGSGSAPLGAIIGGAVGGVAAIGLIAFLFFWLIIRNRKNKDNIQPPEGSKPPPATGSTPPPAQFQAQPDMSAASNVVGSPQSMYKTPIQQEQQFIPPPQQGQYPGRPEYKPYDPTQQQHQQQQQQPAFSPNNSIPSPYGYFAPSPAQSQSPPPGPSPQSPYQGYAPYPPPVQQQQAPQPQQQTVVVNELSGESALGTESHRAELH